MKLSNVLKGWKTSLLGVVIIGVGIMYVYLKEPVDYIVMSILLGGGLMLLLSPDKFVKKLEDIIKNKEV